MIKALITIIITIIIIIITITIIIMIITDRYLEVAIDIDIK